MPHLKTNLLRILLTAASAAGLSISSPAWSSVAQEVETKNSNESTATEAEAGIDEPRLYDGFSGYERKVTTDSPEAQQWFDQGIQLLYGFNHDEAIRSFQHAAEIDPSCAMALWGEAYARGLHINNPEMEEEQSRLAYQAAKRALNAIDDETPVEQALIEAVSVRYAWPIPDDRQPLDEAYAEAMERVWHNFPDDADVGALFAESLMNLQPWDLWTSAGVPKGRTMEVVAVLEKTLRVNPQHPGANHFYIHAVEASPWPERATDAAERLVDLVPGSGHLVHMPSHIFIRTGRYAEAAKANERAIAADEAYFAKAPTPDFYSLYFVHNIHFLAYAAMMEGRYETAINAARKLEKTIPPPFLESYVKMADGYMATSLLVMIRFGKWEEILQEPAPPEWRLFSRAERHFARSVAAANLQDIQLAEAELKAMEELMVEMDEDWRMQNNTAEDVLNVAREMALGEIAFHRGDREEAFAYLRHAVELEEGLIYDEPPGWMQPVRHALGALLLADGQADEALEVYRADLVRHPHNAWSLLGMHQSLTALGDAEAADKLRPTVELAWARADVQPVASCYCHPDAKKVVTGK